MSQGALFESEPTILYVDDQPSHLALFKKVFQGDYLVLTAQNPDEGLEILDNHEVFLVLADHNMPRMTGVDFLQKAQEISPKAVRAVLSAYTNEEIIKEAVQRAKVAGTLTKPWKLGPMRQFIEESYRLYERGVPVGDLVPTLPPPPPSQRDPIEPEKICRFFDRLEARVDKRGARRIFLKYVEPPLKSFVPTFRRPAPEFLTKAQREILQGNLLGAERILTEYLKNISAKSETETPSAEIVN